MIPFCVFVLTHCIASVHTHTYQWWMAYPVYSGRVIVSNGHLLLEGTAECYLIAGGVSTFSHVYTHTAAAVVATASYDSHIAASPGAIVVCARCRYVCLITSGMSLNTLRMHVMHSWWGVSSVELSLIGLSAVCLCSKIMWYDNKYVQCVVYSGIHTYMRT